MAHNALQEASDPATAPERLRELARHKHWGVQRAAWKNPSLPETAWRAALLEGEPEVWANPMASIYVLAWTPNDDDWLTIGEAAQRATEELWPDPTRCSPEGKALINAKVQEWWATSESAKDMMWILGSWADAKGINSSEHKEVIRILVQCVRTAPNLTTEDRQALDLLETWSLDGKDQYKKASTLAFSKSVKDTVLSTRNARSNPWNATFQILKSLDDTAEKPRHDRLLADLIRQEMPLPPVVD